MDKESIFELQKVDCNCNDCKFMVRDNEKFKVHCQSHHDAQLNLFNVRRQKILNKAKWWKDFKEDDQKYKSVTAMAEKMKFEFNKSAASTNFGKCNKFDKDVTFIPNVLQLDTQKCFEHRRANQN